MKNQKQVTKSNLTTKDILENIQRMQNEQVEWIINQLNLIQEIVDKIDDEDNAFLKEQIKLLRMDDTTKVAEIVFYLNVWFSKLCILYDHLALLNDGLFNNQYKQDLLSKVFIKKYCSKEAEGLESIRFKYCFQMTDQLKVKLFEECNTAKKAESKQERIRQVRYTINNISVTF